MAPCIKTILVQVLVIANGTPCLVFADNERMIRLERSTASSNREEMKRTNVDVENVKKGRKKECRCTECTPWTGRCNRLLARQVECIYISTACLSGTKQD